MYYLGGRVCECEGVSASVTSAHVTMAPTTHCWTGNMASVHGGLPVPGHPFSGSVSSCPFWVSWSLWLFLNLFPVSPILFSACLYLTITICLLSDSPLFPSCHLQLDSLETCNFIFVSKPEGSWILIICIFRDSECWYEAVTRACPSDHNVLNPHAHTHALSDSFHILPMALGHCPYPHHSSVLSSIKSS